MRRLSGSLMLRLLAWGIAIALVGPVSAQETNNQGAVAAPNVEMAPTVLTLDIDRLFAQSEFGQRITLSYATNRDALLVENRRIADALRQEELALAGQRSTMDVDVFRTEAEAFDAKAQGIRRAQDAKERELEAIETSGRDQFLAVAQPILVQLMVDRGAVVILDLRSVPLSLGRINVTDEAIERINSAIGDGMDIAPLAVPAPAPEN